MKSEAIPDSGWDLVIQPQKSLFHINYREIWKYKDLILLFVRRDLIAIYKQTILGPLWHIIQPLLTTITFTIIFGRIAKLSTDGLPQVLFYMAGVVTWTYFGESLKKTSGTFIANAGIFGKVYFPRLVMPISVVISNLISFTIQFSFFLCFLAYFYFFTDSQVHPNLFVFLLPFLIVIMAFLGLGFGIIISSMTTKYRDLAFVVGFGVQLFMYASPVIYPLSSVSGKLRYIILANPMTSVIETVRYAFLGVGEYNPLYILYSLSFTIVILFLGILMFNRIEKNFTDTI